MFCSPCLTDVDDDHWLDHLVLEHLDKMEHRIMTAIGDVQGQLDQVGQQLTDLASTLSTDVSTIEGNQAATVDLTTLNNGLAAVSAAVASVSALANPAPEPEPAPAP